MSKKLLGLTFIPLFATPATTKSNECHIDAHAQQDAEALAHILEEGGSMMDQHEMMEMMMNKKDSLRPYPFEKLMANCAMFK